MLLRVEGAHGHGPPGAALDAVAGVLAAREFPDGGDGGRYEVREFVVLGGVPAATCDAEIHRRPPSGLLRSVGRVTVYALSLIHISEPTRLLSISYAVFC